MAFAPHSFAESINFLAILISPLWFNPPSAMTYVFFSVNVVESILNIISSSKKSI